MSADEFARLRADNWQAVMRDPRLLDPEIRGYLEAENAYADAALADTSALQDTLFAEMKDASRRTSRPFPIPTARLPTTSVTARAGSTR